MSRDMQVRLLQEVLMCGMGKCKTCGDVSYECGTLGACGCFNDLKDIVNDVDEDKKEEFIKKVRTSKKWKFVKKHGFP